MTPPNKGSAVDIHSLESDVVVLEKDVHAIDNRVTVLETHFGYIKNDIQDLHESIQTLNETSNDGFDKILDRLTAAEKNQIEFDLIKKNTTKKQKIIWSTIASILTGAVLLALKIIFGG